MNEEGLFQHHVLAAGKLSYAKGTRPNVPCILCAVREEHPDVQSFKIYEEELCFICLNLYPYNPGHLMVIPTRHVLRLEDLTDKERNRIFEVVGICQKLLQACFNPTGFNVGYNQGQFSGASVDHLHVHVVPRYKSELGYIDLIGQTRVVVQPVSEVFALLKARIGEFFGIK
jgi:ATP adenylyltransferase